MRASASTTAEQASASNAGGRASASTTAKEATASNAGGSASASKTVRVGASRNAGRKQISPNGTEEVQLPLVRLCKTLLRQGFLPVFLDVHTFAVTSKMHVTFSVTKTPHKHPHTHTQVHTQYIYSIVRMNT